MGQMSAPDRGAAEADFQIPNACWVAIPPAQDRPTKQARMALAGM